MVFEAFELSVMGKILTFDVVTGYGLVCGLVFLAGFVYAMHYEKRIQVSVSRDKL